MLLLSFLALTAAMLLAQADSSTEQSHIGACPINAKTLLYLGDITHVNSTATVAFDAPSFKGGSDPWYMYLSVSASISKSQPFTMGWLGVPESVLEDDALEYTRVCGYHTGEREGRIKNKSGKDTCKGVFSDECVDTFSKPLGSGSFDGCPDVFDMRPCGENFLRRSSDTLSKNITCFSRTLPGIDLPKGYVVAAIGGHGGQHYSDDTRFAPYDRAISEVEPWIMTFYSNRTGNDSYEAKYLETQAVCAVADEVQPGSRSAASKDVHMTWSLLAILLVFSYC